MSKPWSTRAAWALAALSLAGCGAEPETQAQPAEKPLAVAPAPMSLARPQFKTLDDQLLEVAATLPSFAGMYHDEEGRLVVRLTQPEAEARLAAPAAAQAISAVFGPERIPAAGLVAATAAHPFTRLKALQERITPDVLAVAGVVMTDVDERTNRVVIGIERADVRRGVDKVLHRLGAARDMDMIEVVEMGPTFPTNVQGGWRPVTGGLQIETPGKYCTLGFAALWGGTLGFVSNSHCTQTQGGVESTPAWQAVYPNLAGTEVNDPTYSSGGSCPAGRICRASDSAFFQANTSVNALIAATPGPWNLSISSWLEVPGKVLYPSQGQVVYKTGRTTGTTSGTIQWACATVNSGGGAHTYFCNYIATSAAQNGAGGDSGSPVYFLSGNNATLTGIVWGAGSNPWHFAFSPLGGVQNDLGIVPYCQGSRGC
jgi:hypothetical protein